MPNKLTKNGVSVPSAIVLAAIIIAFAVMWRGGSLGGEEVVSLLRAVDETDFIRGNLDAPVTIVEYSDFECPFCAQLHPTLGQLVDDRPDDVKWVYRHFPVHREAATTAVAAECIGTLAGHEAGWSFIDSSFENQRSLNRTFYDTEATTFGIDAADFASCMSDGATQRAVQTDYQEAINTGGQGTPHSVIITASGELRPFSGALPYANINTLIDQALVN